MLRFNARMWSWIRCGSLIYVVVDNQTEKIKITRTTHLNRDIDIYVEDFNAKKKNAKKYLLNVGHLSRPQCVDFCGVGYATRILLY